MNFAFVSVLIFQCAVYRNSMIAAAKCIVEIRRVQPTQYDFQTEPGALGVRSGDMVE
jgi:hypothetical protein